MNEPLRSYLSEMLKLQKEAAKILASCLSNGKKCLLSLTSV